MKWELSGQGGNMVALEKVYKGYQVLISDGFGEAPSPGKPWVMSVYVKDKYGVFKESPKKTWRGAKFDFKTAEAKVREYVNHRSSKANKRS